MLALDVPQAGASKNPGRTREGCLGRIVPQGGDPLGNGTGGSGQTLKAEFNKRRHVEGTVAMARAANPDSAASLDDLASIPGSLPDLRRTDLPPCRYSERCPRKIAACARPLPHAELDPGHIVACWNPLPRQSIKVPTVNAPSVSAA